MRASCSALRPSKLSSKRCGMLPRLLPRDEGLSGRARACQLTVNDEAIVLIGVLAILVVLLSKQRAGSASKLTLGVACCAPERYPGRPLTESSSHDNAVTKLSHMLPQRKPSPWNFNSSAERVCTQHASHPQEQQPCGYMEWIIAQASTDANTVQGVGNGAAQ